jgi:subtilisin family serine protease
VRLAAPSDCPRNVNCIPGFKRVYGVDPTSVFRPLKVADAGIQALDDGTAEVAVAFSSNPQLSRPDILELRDDKHMISADHVLPVVRRSILQRYGAALRNRVNQTSALLSTLELRGLNQQVIDARLPEAVGGEFADANALGGPAAHRRRGPVIRIGYQAFDENKTLAYLYAESLRGAGFAVRVRAIGGLRAAAVAAMRDGRLDMWLGYSGSLRGYLGGGPLTRSLARIGAQPLKASPAQDRNGFAMKRDVARALHISTLSELATHWPKAAASRTPPGAKVVDTRQDEQWAVAPGSVLDLPAAWELAQGRGVTVAVVDSGVRIDHPDLAPNIWTNFNEIPGNGIDDDHNGYVDDVHGIDLTSRTSSQDLHDGWGHGTHVSGIVAAARNGQGVVGVAPQAKIMVVKVLDDQGRGTTGQVAEGIRYAAANGAKIINLSLGSDADDPAMDAAIRDATASGVLVVASAGNQGRDTDTKPFYPASLAAPNLLAVASTDPNAGRDLSGFSNYGQLTVQVAAPGGEILSTSKDGGYEDKSGTSMAAPMVSGVAALAAGVNPQISPVDLRAVIMGNATRSQLPLSSGYVDALHSVLAASTLPGSSTGQRPQLTVLEATRKSGRVNARAAVLGATAAIKRYKVTVDRRAVAQLTARASVFTVAFKNRKGKTLRIVALDAAGHPLASGQLRITALRAGKGGVGSGSGVGS